MERVWDFLTHGHAVREVGGYNPGCAIRVWIFHPTRQLARFSSPTMPYICLILNLVIISPRDEAVNSCP